MSTAKGFSVKRDGKWVTHYKLEIGAGRNPDPNYISVDRTGKPDVLADLNGCGETGGGLPFDDDTFNAVKASHVIEHIHNILPLMQELHRVTAPGGEMLIRCPHGASDNADEDPTHVRRMFQDSCVYWSQAAYGGADYGYRGDWKVKDRILVLRPDPAVLGFAENEDLDGLSRIVRTFRNLVDEMIFILECVKPIRIAGTFREEAPIRFVLPSKPPILGQRTPVDKLIVPKH